MYCKLKEKADHTFGLPVLQAFNSPIPVTGPDGTQHPRTIFLVWTDAQLNAIGYARMIETPATPPEGMKRKSFSDKMTAGVVTRTWTHENLPPPPPPNPEDYKMNRKDEIAKTVGGGSYEEALGNQMDSFLKWATLVRMQQSNIALAIDGVSEISEASRTALKAALDPVFDLPADLDDALGKWTAAKAKFPKPE